MIQKIFLSALLGIVFFASSGISQKVAVVDVDDILANIDEYRQAQDKMDKMAEQWREEIAGHYDNIKSMYSKYQADQVLLSDNARKDREEEIVQKEKQVRELQRQRFGPEGELFNRRQELVQPIQDKVFAAIETYANSRGYDLIFDKSSTSGLLFTSDKYDKTNEIKEKLNIN